MWLKKGIVLYYNMSVIKVKASDQHWILSPRPLYVILITSVTYSQGMKSLHEDRILEAFPNTVMGSFNTFSSDRAWKSKTF